MRGEGKRGKKQALTKWMQHKGGQLHNMHAHTCVHTHTPTIAALGGTQQLKGDHVRSAPYQVGGEREA